MQKIRILYVEDEASVREELAAFLLRFSGKNELVLAANGREGLKHFREGSFDLVVTDIIMPVMGGVEMIRRIREENEEIPIFMITANTDTDFFIESFDLHVDGYLPKPVDLDLLAQKIRSVASKIALRERYACQRTVLQEIARLQGSMLVVLDRQLHPIYANDQMARFLGCEREVFEENDYAQDIFACFWKFLCPNPQSEAPETDPEKILDLFRRKGVAELRAFSGRLKSFKVDPVMVEETGHTILTFSEITGVMRERKEYEYRAYHDELTGLGNRFKFNNEAMEAIFSTYQKGKPLSLAVADLDFFKRINDRYGHSEGDRVLKDFARFLQIHCQEGRDVYRWGGEEFVILMPESDLQAAKEQMETLCRQMEEEPFGEEGEELRASFGVAQLRGDQETPESLFDRADRALYRAKEKGRNRVQTA